MIDITKATSRITPAITEVRNILHENPELSLQEFKTCQLLEDYIKEHIPHKRLKRVGETGLLLEIEGKKTGPKRMIAFRGDIDALPVQESADAEPRSRVSGVMHACGHDVHGAINLGAAQVLAENRDHFSGIVCFLFQPAEEILAGAQLFLNDPDIDMSLIDAMVGIHVSPEIDAGQIGVKKGPILASVDEFRITVHGKGGHGAHPHTVVDPIVAAASLIMNMQTMVSREISAPDSAVVSTCMINAGSAHNIIPEKVELRGTIRTLEPRIRDKMETSLKRIAKMSCEVLRAYADVEYIRGVPSLTCETDWVDRAVKVGKHLLGEENVISLPVPSMGGDDFAFLKENKPGVFIRLGTRTPGGPYGSMHSPYFYCAPAAIPAGILTIAGIALDFFDIEYV